MPDGQQQEVKPWNEITATFDPMMPKATYEALREQYFWANVAPKMQKAEPSVRPDIHFESWKQQTERPSLMTPTDKMVATMGIGAMAAKKEVLAPLAAMSPSVKGELDRTEKELTVLKQLGDREGINTEVPEMFGKVAGSAPLIAASWETMGPLTKVLGKTVLGSGKMAQFLTFMGQNRLAMATYSAIRDEEGDRLLSAAHGASYNIGWDLAFGLPVFLKGKGLAKTNKEAEDLARLTMEKGAPTPEVGAAVSDYIAEQAKGSRAAGFPSDYYRVTPNKPGVRLVVKDNQKRILELTVRPAAETEAFGQAKSIIENGGSFLRWEHGSDDFRSFQKAQTLFHRMNEPSIPTTIRATPPVIEQMGKRREGIPIREDMVAVRPQPPAGFPSEQQIAEKFKARNIGPDHAAQIRRMLEITWDPKIPLANKANSMRLLQSANLDDLMPSRAQMLEMHNKTGAVAPGQSTADSVRAEAQQAVRQEMAHWKMGEKQPAEDLSKRVAAGELTGDQASAISAMRAEAEQAFRGGASKASVFNPISQEFETISEAELSRLEDIVTKGKQVGSPRGAIGPEPKIPTGRPTTFRVLPANMNPLVVPPNEQYRVNIRPARSAIIAPAEVVQQKLPGAEGFVIGDLKGTPMEHLVPAGSSPWMVLASNASKETIYHEGVHYGLARVGLNLEELLLSQLEPSIRSTAADLSGGLTDLYHMYRNLPPHLQVEEAFTHAAEAVRFGNKGQLAMLGKLDAGVESVLAFVNKSAEEIRNAIYPKLGSLNGNILERQMNDLIRRSSKDVSYELRRAAEAIEVNAYYDSSSDMYKIVSQGGTQQWFKTDDELWSFLDDSAKIGDTAADASFWAQLRGARGPLVPPGHEPTNRAPSMERPPERGWAGFSALTAWVRPTGPWVAGIQKKLTAAMAPVGKTAPALYDTWRKVDDAVGAAEAWNRGMLERASDILAGSGNKVHDYFQALTYPKGEMAKAQKALKLNEKDMQRIGALTQWIDDYQGFTKIPAWEFLNKHYPNLRSFGFETDMVFGKAFSPSSKFNPSFWDDAIRYQSEWDPKEDHVGKFMNFLLRKGVDKMFLNEPLEEFQKLINTKTPEGYFFGPVRQPLANYANYVKGIPDASTRALGDAVHAFENSLSKRLGQLSKRIPGLPNDFKLPSGLFNKMMIFSYAAGLGGRPSIMARDAFTVVMTGLPILGPSRFMKALSQLGKESYQEANAAGALLRRENVGELYGDITQELGITSGKTLSLDNAVRISNALLQPTRWGNNAGRTLMYRAGKSAVEESVPLFRAGKIDADRLLKDTSVWFADDPVINRFLKDAADVEKPISEIAHSIGKELVDLTQWPYRRGTQPGILRTGIGRIMGQYGYWPSNYIEYMRRLAAKAPRYGSQTVEAAAIWSAVNFAGVSGMAAIGADTNNWFWTSPMAYGGGPHFDFALNLMKASDNSQQGREARRRVLEYPMNFIPASVELRAIMRAEEKGESIPGPGLWRVLGFKPLNELEKDREFTDWIKYQSGYGSGRY